MRKMSDVLSLVHSVFGNNAKIKEINTMALHGNWGSYVEKEHNGRKFIVAEVEYNGKPWTNLSTFDAAVIAVAESLNPGEPVVFETKKTGKYTNLTLLEPSDGSMPKASAPKKQDGGGMSSGYRKDTKDEILGKTLTQLVNGFLSAGKIPDDKEMFSLAIIAKCIAEGDYFKGEK